MIRLLLAALSFALVVLVSDRAAAQTDCDPDDPSKCAAPIARGAKAPFDGQLLTPKLAIDLSLKADQCQERMDLSVGFAKRELQLNLELERSLRENDKKHAGLELESMTRDRDRWKEYADVPFYREPLFIAAMTTVVVGAIVIGSSHLIQATAPR